MRQREYRKRWMRAWRKAHREQHRIYCADWKARNPEQLKSSARRWWKKQRQLCTNQWLAKNLRTRIYLAVKGRRKLLSMAALLGCSLSRFRRHIQQQFKRGMNWKNYGRWHIDHRQPCSKFDLSSLDEQKRCFHFSNLQPLWAYENIAKGGGA